MKRSRTSIAALGGGVLATLFATIRMSVPSAADEVLPPPEEPFAGNGLND